MIKGGRGDEGSEGDERSEGDEGMSNLVFITNAKIGHRPDHSGPFAKHTHTHTHTHTEH